MVTFLVGTLIGLLASGSLCVHHFRSAITRDIGPQLKRMHADIEPRLRRIENQIGLIESAVNMAMATMYAEMSSRPPAVPAPRPNDENHR
jgi:hypothetical protein